MVSSSRRALDSEIGKGAGQMPAEAELLGIIDLQPSEMSRVRRALGWPWLMSAVISATIFVIAVAKTIIALRSAWQTGQWDDQFWDPLLTVTAIGLVQSAAPLTYVLLKPLARVSRKQSVGGALALRAAAAARDSRFAPSAEAFNRALEREPIPALPAQFAPAKRPNGALVTDKTLSGAGLVVFGLLALTVAGILGLNAHGETAPIVAVAASIGIGAAIVPAGIVSLLHVRQMRRPQIITADELGLSWTSSYPHRREMHVAWSDIRSFFVVEYLSGLTESWAFVVDGPSATLAWRARHSTKDGALPASDQLSRLILAYTGLPLLDLSKAAELASTRRMDKHYAEAIELFSTLTSAGATLWPNMPRPVTRRRIALAAAAVFSPLLLIPVFYLLGQGLQHYQLQQYTALLRQVRSHQPLYHDSLMAPDGDWMVSAATTDNPDSYAFADGSYVISLRASDQQTRFPQAFAPGVYHDAAVEVVSRRINGSSFGTVGLVLHADASGNDEVVFQVSWTPSAAEWAVLRLGVGNLLDPTNKWGYFSQQSSSAIHAAPGTANRLTVVLRGSQVICYINDEYVGTFNDPLPESGRIGFGVFATYDTVAFNDFTIYPA
jgi:hypothetical protein